MNHALESALDVLWQPLALWVHYGHTADKKLLRDAYASLHPRQRAALDMAIHAVMGGPVTMYRRMKPGDTPKQMGLASLHAEHPGYMAAHAFVIDPSDVLMHYALPGSPLGSNAFGHEKEVILKPEAQPMWLGIEEPIRSNGLRRNGKNNVQAAMEYVAERADVEITWDWCSQADAKHAKSARQYMHTFHRDGVICVARAAKNLSFANLSGLISHEVAHVLNGLGPGDEQEEYDADATASRIVGKISYDKNAVQTIARGVDRRTALKRYRG